MMRQYELVERVQRYNPDANEDLLNRAYVYAMRAHGNQMRASGDPYFTHPLEVAAILTELKVDDATIVAALLHDTIEDTDATREEIERVFGRDIAQLVEGLTKLKRLDLVVKQAAQAENLRKLLLAIVSDVRVLLVKLADRLHNMRTLHFVPPHKRQRIAEETLEIYAPLAGRMGMQDMRDELEDLAFVVVHPEPHATIEARLETLRERLAREPSFQAAGGDFIAMIENELGAKLAERGIAAEVHGRQKRPYSIYRKTLRKAVEFEQLSDIYGFRVIVPTVEDCYRALGVVHTAWPMVPGRYKDYISIPKQNDYRSLHTTVIGPGRQRVELQIRTEEMHRIAEFGIAAHALYKDGAFVAHDTEGRIILNTESRAYEWLRMTVERLSEGSTPEEFLEHTKLELFHDQVFCFTPKGKLIALPRGATPIDFAYAVHTDVGNTCIGCKINGKISPLSSELANGDEVEVITSKAQVPPPAWESIVITGKARYEIRKATRAAVRGQYAGLGRTIVKRAFERAGKSYDDDKVEAVLKRLARNSLEDVLAAVGRGEMSASDVVRAVHPDWRDERTHQAIASGQIEGEGWFGATRGKGVKFKVPGQPNGSALPIRGLKTDLPVRFAPEGGAVPGDRIVGIVTPGEGITIYPIHAEALKAFEDNPERWLDVRWDVGEDQDSRFPARLELTTVNEPGSLAQVAQVIAEHDGNIDNVKMSRRSPESTEVTIDLEVWDLKHLNSIISQLKTKSVVSRVRRVSG
jgi:guanosine-3',5'-bis(diphosphate) 3'-pyrophosphohydrolase